MSGPAGRECARAPGAGGGGAEDPRPERGTAPGRSGRPQERGAPSGAPARCARGRAVEAGVGAWPPVTSSPGTAPPRRSVPADGPGFQWEPGRVALALAFKAPVAAGFRVGSGGASRPRLCSGLADCGRPGRPPALPCITQVAAGGGWRSDTTEGAALSPERRGEFGGVGFPFPPHSCMHNYMCSSVRFPGYGLESQRGHSPSSPRIAEEFEGKLSPLDKGWRLDSGGERGGALLAP